MKIWYVTPEWVEYDPAHWSYCMCHYELEPIPPEVFIICYECGHVWTRKGLVRTYKAESKHHAPKLGLRNTKWEKDLTRLDVGRVNIWRWLRHCWSRWRITPEKIYFCQECIHDF